MSKRGASTTALLPPRNMAGPALLAVTLVMTLLACLALGSTVLVDRAAERWLTRATSAVSIQIVETRSQTADEQLPAVLRELSATPGVANFRVLDKASLSGSGAVARRGQHFNRFAAAVADRSTPIARQVLPKLLCAHD